MILKGATKSRMSSMFVMVDEHLEPNVYNIKPVDGKGPVHIVNLCPLQDLKITQELKGSDDPNISKKGLQALM